MQRPVRWLWAISRCRVCTTASPILGYELCLRKFRSQECEGLDLSCWQVAINGAEPAAGGNGRRPSRRPLAALFPAEEHLPLAEIRGLTPEGQL